MARFPKYKSDGYKAQLRKRLADLEAELDGLPAEPSFPGDAVEGMVAVHAESVRVKVEEFKITLNEIKATMGKRA